MLELNNLNLARVLKRKGTSKLNDLFKRFARVTRGEDEIVIATVSNNYFVNNVFYLDAVVTDNAHKFHSVLNKLFNK